jgi:hypothetical protein
MSESQPPETPPADESTGPRPPFGSVLRPEDRARLLANHFRTYAGTHTTESLGRAAMAAGYSHEEVLAAIARVEASFAAAEASAPKRALAQRAILAAYGVTYLVLAVALLTQRNAYGYGSIALFILTVVLGLALLLSMLWARRSRWVDQGTSVNIAVILSLPVILLVLVAGSCVVTTFPLST